MCMMVTHIQCLVLAIDISYRFVHTEAIKLASFLY